MSLTEPLASTGDVDLKLLLSRPCSSIEAMDRIDAVRPDPIALTLGKFRSRSSRRRCKCAPFEDLMRSLPGCGVDDSSLGFRAIGVNEGIPSDWCSGFNVANDLTRTDVVGYFGGRNGMGQLGGQPKGRDGFEEHFCEVRKFVWKRES